MNPDTNQTASKKKSETGDSPASPYGPQPHGVDETAGGADSSPHENESTDERQRKVDRGRDLDRTAGTDGTNQSA